MRILRTIGLMAVLAVFTTGPALAAVATVGLGTAGNFAVVAHETITNTGPTTITGDVGLSPGTSITGFNTVTLNGTQHVADAAALQAMNDVVTAYTNAAGRTPTTIGTELGGQTLTSGVYNTQNGALGLTGVLTLNGEGDPNAVFIFQAASTLTTASGSRVAFINSAQACNVFWKVTSSATLGTRSAFAGNILALVSVTMNTNATLLGRALAQTGAVTLDTNVISRAVCAAPAPTPSPTAAPSSTAAPSPTAAPAATSTPPPTSTSGSQGSGSGPSPSILLVFVGLAAAAAWVTLKRIDTDR